MMFVTTTGRLQIITRLARIALAGNIIDGLELNNVGDWSSILISGDTSTTAFLLELCKIIK